MTILTVITACAGREENLINAIVGWKKLGAKIIISDFNPTPVIEKMLSSIQLMDNDIQVLHTGSIGQKWCLTWAYNLAFKHVKTPVVLKIDTDDIILTGTEGIFEQLASNCLNGQSVYRGNYLLEGKVPQATSSGVFMMSKTLLLSLRGFTPFILTYGWDDIDLYQRASLIAEVLDMPSALFKKIPHDKNSRYSSTELDDASLGESISLGLRGFTCMFNRLLVTDVLKINGYFLEGAPLLHTTTLSSLQLASMRFFFTKNYSFLISESARTCGFPLELAKKYIGSSRYASLLKQYLQNPTDQF